MLEALIVAYAFPPVGGAGVQRVSKLAKYLPLHGVRPRVLTVANPSVPLTDESLARDLPRGLEIMRARSLEPGYGAKKAAWAAAADAKPSRKTRAVRFAAGVVRQVAYPDIQVLWMPGAHAALAKTMLSSRPPDVVLISGPPFSQFLLAPLSRTRAKVVLDYRDEWALIRSGYEMTRSRIEKLIGDPLEAALLRLASMVTTATEEFRQNLLDRFRFLDPARVVAIPNGYDPEDFPADMPLPPKDEFVISNVGTVFRLTSPKGFLEAVKKLRASRPDLTKALRVKFVGRIVDLEQAAFEGAGVEQFGYLDHDEAVRMLGASHLVLVVLDDVEGNERIYPAKIFEAMYVKRPTLTLAPPGALSRLVEKHRVGDLLRPRDVDGICALLERKLLDFRDGKPETTMHPVDIERFDRRHTAGQFADVIKRCV